jgi:LacI family transcriptional regulator
MDMTGFAGKRKLEGILDSLGADRHWIITLLPADEDFTSETMEYANRMGIDGLILLNFPRRAIVRQIIESGMPAVIEGANDTSGHDGNVIHINLDDQELVRAAVDHFTGQHVFRSFGFVQAAAGNKWSIDREAAFGDALKAQGIEFSSCHPAQHLLTPWLRALKKPAAVLAANDATAACVIKTARKLNMNTPTDLALLGIDNDTKFCDKLGIDSIAIDFIGAGKMAADALDKLMGKKAVNTHTIKYGTSGIAFRGSSMSSSPAFKLVRSALAFIDAHACDGISVNDVVTHIHVSRRLADLRFRETIGRTILDCIQERRMAEVKRLLKDTDMPISAISGKVGISNTNHLKNVFRREVGTSMRNYRSGVKS